MLLGYTFILLAAVCWGASGVIGKHWASTGFADATLLSQTRVTFSWLVLLIATAIALVELTSPQAAVENSDVVP